MLEEEQRAVVDAGQPGAEAAAKALLLVLAADELLLGLPLHPEGRIGQHVVELVPGEMVVGEAIAESDVLDLLALDHHVRAADGVGLGVVVLAEDLQAGIGVELAEVLLRHREHPAGAAGRIVEGLDDALGGQHVGVRQEKEVHHQADDLPGGEVIARLFVARPH